MQRWRAPLALTSRSLAPAPGRRLYGQFCMTGSRLLVQR
jgi:hypothetical protein